MPRPRDRSTASREVKRTARLTAEIARRCERGGAYRMKFLPPPGKISPARCGLDACAKVALIGVPRPRISPVFSGASVLTKTAQAPNSIAFYSMVGRISALGRLASVTSPGEAGARHENKLCNAEERTRQAGRNAIVASGGVEHDSGVDFRSLTLQTRSRKIFVPGPQGFSAGMPASRAGRGSAARAIKPVTGAYAAAPVRSLGPRAKEFQGRLGCGISLNLCGPCSELLHRYVSSGYRSADQAPGKSRMAE